MRYIRLSLVPLLLLVGVVAMGTTGCSQSQSDVGSTSSIDSTLALQDVPDAEITPEEEYTPPADTPPPAPKRRSTPPPPPKPAPKPVAPATATIPAGTALSLSLNTPLTTKTAQVGDRFTAVVTEPIIVGNRVAIPQGSIVHGHVAATEQPGKISGKGMMQLAYDQLEFEGRNYSIASVGDTIWGKGGTKKDVGMIAGGAVAGAILGKVLGGNAKKGAVIGAAGGTAASLATRGPQLELEADKRLVLSLDRQVTVTQPKLES